MLGYKPSKEKGADELRNKNLNAPDPTKQVPKQLDPFNPMPAQLNPSDFIPKQLTAATKGPGNGNGSG